MKLDCVLTAVNDNRLYLDFIPIFIITWQKLYPDVDIKIVLIMNKIPEDLYDYKQYFILFRPIDGVPTNFTAQFIRLLYPGILNYNNGVMITDMDMLPMNSEYYSKNIEKYEDDKFIYYRGNVCFSHKQIAMCYNIATPKLWGEIFNVSCEEDIRKLINDVNTEYKKKEGSVGWFRDQLYLYEKVMNWHKNSSNFVCLDESKTGYKRLCRKVCDINDEQTIQNIKDGKYSDYHCLRPMKSYHDINCKIVELLDDYLQRK